MRSLSLNCNITNHAATCNQRLCRSRLLHLHLLLLSKHSVLIYITAMHDEYLLSVIFVYRTFAMVKPDAIQEVGRWKKSFDQCPNLKTVVNV